MTRSVNLRFVFGAILLCVATLWGWKNVKSTERWPDPDRYPNFRIQFVDSKTGWIMGPRLFQTVDAGINWKIIDYARVEDKILADDGPPSKKYSMQFLNATCGWRISPKAHYSVEVTEDGGRHWSEPRKTGFSFQPASLVFMTGSRGWLLGEKVITTSDGGETWQLVPELGALGLHYSYFLDGSHGWLASPDGTLATTVDGGFHWTIVKTFSKNVRSIFFVTPEQGWAVGDNSLIVRTKDGGSTWIECGRIADGSKVTSTLMDIFFIEPNLGWISGDNGLILLTVDGGKSWKRTSTPTDAPLASVWFTDQLRGWAVGGNPEPAIPVGHPSNVVLESKDGGNLWIEKTLRD